MELINFASWLANQESITGAQADAGNAQLIVGVPINNKRDGSQFKAFAMSMDEFLGLIPSASYKTYRALLTQTAPATRQTAITLEIGRLYEIELNTTGIFTNVGAADNNPGTQFIATGTTPTSWGDGFVESFGEPVAIVIENTLGGTVVWSYSGVGQYVGTLLGAFPLIKTGVLGQHAIQGSGLFTVGEISYGRITDDTLYVNGSKDAGQDGLLDNWYLEVKVNL